MEVRSGVGGRCWGEVREGERGLVWYGGREGRGERGLAEMDGGCYAID